MGKWNPSKSFDNQVVSVFFFLSFFSVILSSFGNSLHTLIAILILGSIAARVLIQHRVKHKWHWQNPQGKDLIISIGLTLFSFFMVANITVNLHHGMNRDSGRTGSNWQPDNPFNPWEVFSEAIDIFPKLINNPEHSIYFGMFLLFSIAGLLQILYGWKVLYSTEAEFLKHCDLPNPSQSTSSNSDYRRQSKGIFAFFSDRPFTLKKETNSVVIQFSKVTVHDIKENSALLVFMTVFCLAATYGCLATILWTIPDVVNDLTNNSATQENLTSPLPLLLTLGLPGLIQGGLAYFLWQKCLRYVFTTVIIRFTEDKLLVIEKAFGMRSQIVKLSPSELLPLEEKRENTQVPNVRNASWKMRCRRKKIELAGHLLPEAMDLVQDTYDRYRHDSFSNFYYQTQEAYME